MRLRRAQLENQDGFTLVEVMITIIIMGIVFAIASSTWFGAIESRKVDSATNQVAADLRQAHTRATNRLEDWRVQWDPAGSTTYQIGPDDGPDEDTLPDDDALSSYPLPEGTQLSGGTSPIVFNPDGEAQVTGGNITVAAADDCPFNEIEVNPVTSRVEVIPQDEDCP